MTRSRLENLLEYSLRGTASFKSAVLFRQFKRLLELLKGIEPAQCTERDLVWEGPWIRADGRPKAWYEPCVHIYGGRAYIGFDSRRSFEIDLKRQEFVGVALYDFERKKDSGYELLEWFFDSWAAEIKKFLSNPDAYNRFIERCLPSRCRFGKIKRKDLWVSDAEKYFIRDELSKDEIEEFKKAISECDTHRPIEALSRDSFLRFCRVCYDAVFPGEKVSSPVQKYRAHADGRHDGLLDLPPKDARAFARWMKSGRYGGHPWEIVRGGNTTHISLGPVEIKRGWQLWLNGHSTVCAAQTVKMAIALNRAKVRFDLFKKELMARMAEGEDWVGIVPESVFPRYCESYFEGYGDSFLNFMHLLDLEGDKAPLKRIHWYPVKRLFPVSESTSQKVRRFRLLH